MLGLSEVQVLDGRLLAPYMGMARQAGLLAKYAALHLRSLHQKSPSEIGCWCGGEGQNVGGGVGG